MSLLIKFSTLNVWVGRGDAHYHASNLLSLDFNLVTLFFSIFVI